MTEISKAHQEKLDAGKKRYKVCEDAWGDNRKAWLADVKFLKKLEQWPEAIIQQRSLPGKERPCLVVDKLNQYVRQVANDGRQNRPAVKVRPVDSAADAKAAEAFQKRIRAIWQRSNADQAIDTAFDHAVSGGFGFIRLTTDHANDKTFDQEIGIKRVRNPLGTMLDPFIQEADGSDAHYGFVTDDEPKDRFKSKWPNAKMTDWSRDGNSYGEGWLTAETVRVCEYFYREEETFNLHALEDGRIVTEEEYWGEYQGVDVAQRGVILKSREVTSWVIKWCRMTGAEILEEGEWAGKYIPIIPVFGNEVDIEGKVIYSGLIRSAKDAQRLYNFSRSAFAERVALAPKAPWVTEAESVEDFADEWDTANSGDNARLRFRAYNDAGQPLPPPQRTDPTDVPMGFSRDMELSEHDIQAALGMYSASLGEQSNEKSGKAIMARQREGDTATFHFQDNMSRAIGYLGRQLVDLIPKIEDNKRSVQLLGEDGEATVAQIDPDQEEAVVENGSDFSFNFSVGQYEVVTEAGPSYTTKRIEAAEAMMQLTQAAPDLFKYIGDLMVRNMDWPGADQIADRLKAMLPPELQKGEEEGEDPAVAAVKFQAQQMIDQLTQQFEEARTIALQTQQELAAEKANNEAALMKAEADMVKAQTDRMKAEAELARGPEVAPDTTASDIAKADAERERLRLEDEWKKLEAETKVICAVIAAQSKPAPAELGPDGKPKAQDEVEVDPDAPQPVDTNAALLTALQGFQEAIGGFGATLAEMRKPRKILRDAQGNISGVA